uniref:Uncharacterized protein n=1 Tax=Plectus sambesii TaxID=2011161 RepID=A0A914XKP1_9BILA
MKSVLVVVITVAFVCIAAINAQGGPPPPGPGAPSPRGIECPYIHEVLHCNIDTEACINGNCVPRSKCPKPKQPTYDKKKCTLQSGIGLNGCPTFAVEC